MKPGTMQAGAMGGSTGVGAMGAGTDPFATMAAQLTPKRAVSIHPCLHPGAGPAWRQ